MASTISIFVLVLVCSTVRISGYLMCFQCSTTGPDVDCMSDTVGLVNASLGITQKYAKNCTDADPEWDRCMIETVQYNGKYLEFHRACTDGKTFPLHFNVSRFQDLAADNATTCAYITELKQVACYSFCRADFCNGPQPEPKKPCRNVTESYYDSYYDVEFSEEYEICGALGRHAATAWMKTLTVITCLFFFMCLR